MAGSPTRGFGATGMKVTTLGYGAREIAGMSHGRECSEENAERILNAVLDSGINFIDTSIDYGLSETRIGKYISHRRSEFFLATKCGCLLNAPLGAPSKDLRSFLRTYLQYTVVWRAARVLMPWARRVAHIYTPENIVAGVEQSLRRLKTDYIDLLQFHGDPSMAQLQEHGAIEAALELKKQGKVRFIGVSSKLPHIVDHIDLGAFDAVQMPYSALQPEHEDIISKAVLKGAAAVVRGAGRPRDPTIRARTDAAWQAASMADLLGNMSRMAFIIRYTITNPAVSTAIIGTLSPEHLRENVEAVEAGPLPADVYEEARRRLAKRSLT